VPENGTPFFVYPALSSKLTMLPAGLTKSIENNAFVRVNADIENVLMNIHYKKV